MQSLQHKKLFLLVIALISLVTLFTSLYLIRRQQDIKSRAQASTVLSFTGTGQVEPGSSFQLDIMLDPGSNLVSITEVEVTFDQNILQLINNSPVVINSTSFPEILTAPEITSGNIKFSVSTGNDPLNAITTPVKVATIYFASNPPPNSTYPITTNVNFGPNTHVYSISANDETSEDVLLSGGIGEVTIEDSNQPTTTPTATVAPSITTVPTATQTPSPTSTTIPTSTPTLIPTNIPPPIPTTNPDSTKLQLKLFLHGIWPTGDNVNPVNNSANRAPINPTREVYVELLDITGQAISGFSQYVGYVQYNNSNGLFEGSVDLGSNISTGNYKILIKTDRYLRSIVGAGFTPLTESALNILPTSTLIAGDINGDNILNILDYQVLYDCGYGDVAKLTIYDSDATFNSGQCQAHGNNRFNADLDDNGFVNQFDFSLFFRNWTTQFGD